MKKPMTVLIKPASGNCNMSCRYCFYADEQAHRETASYGLMSGETMRHLIDRALEHAGSSCVFAFQGGEPMLRGLDFYRDFISYVRQNPLAEKLNIGYALQTNGILIDADWARFLAENQFLVGLSLDGPKEIHDRYRLDRKGEGTYQRVMSAARLFDQYHVEYNSLTVVTAGSVRNAQKIQGFLSRNGMEYQQYIECLDPLGEEPGGHEYSLTPRRYGRFLKDMFDVWYREQKRGHHLYNRYFENLLMILNGQEPESCGQRGVCGAQWVIEADGSAYPCDFYVLDEWKLGNVNDDSFRKMERKLEELKFVDFSREIPGKCSSCQWLDLCRNGCRRHREQNAEKGPGVNYFCDAYREFFDYAFPRLLEIYRERAKFMG